MKEPEGTHLIQTIKALPQRPGIYQFVDQAGKIIYVGKAKNLKTRVSSYFQKDRGHSGKIRIMIKKTVEIRYIVVETEADALILENSLIKKHQPRYNVMWKDDKTYPWICIKNESFPRVFQTRNMIKDGSHYFGPFASARVLQTMLSLIRQLYPLRTCNLNLDPKNIKKKKFKACLEYHLGNCAAPCEGKQSASDYLKNIEQIKLIIKGNVHQIIRQLKISMNDFAKTQAFEKAQMVKEKLLLMEKYQSKSTVVNPAIEDADVFSIITENDTGYVNFIKVMKGAIIQSHTLELKKKLDETDQELLELAIAELRQRFHSTAKEIIIPFNIEFPNVKKTIPKIGDKKKLLELSERNASFYKKSKEIKKELTSPDRHKNRKLATLKKDLRLSTEPTHIECIDNSNIQGSEPVAALVVFKDTIPARKEYRHYNIKTVEGPNDFASMEEVVYRRYKRLITEGKDLPQLLIVDGGKGQLNAAIKSLKKLNLKHKIAVIGIAKRLEEIFFPNDPVPLYLDKQSESLKIIQQLRNEAHRFGITHHRKRREKTGMQTELSNISGIGEKTITELFKHFKSIQRIKKADKTELIALIGAHKTKLLQTYFNKN